MIESNKINKIKEWRKIVLFFAAFFCLGLVLASCKKKKNYVGKDLLYSDEIMSSGGVDTFQIKSYTVIEDSVKSADPEFNLIGSYTDEVFGTVEANFYTQLTLSGFSPDFGDLSQVKIDSAVMAFRYGGNYGKLDEQLFEAYEITEALSKDSSYWRFSVAETSTQNLVPTANDEGRIKPNVEKQVVVGNDTLSAQLRIPMDTVFARNLLSLAESSTNDNDFLEVFKGLHFKVNNPTFSQGRGGILYLDPAHKNSKLTVYYTKDGIQEFFDFLIIGKSVDFNHVETDFTNTQVQQVIDNPEMGTQEFYAQSFSTRAKIEFNTIQDLPDNIVLHDATLELPVNYFEGSDFYMSSEVVVSAELFEDDERKYVVSTVQYNKQKRAYVINLRSYIQNIIKGEIENKGIYISPKRFNTTTERIIFNGADSDNKKTPKLNIIYTEL